MKSFIQFNQSSKKYELIHDGKVILKSFGLSYLQETVANQSSVKVRKLGIKEAPVKTKDLQISTKTEQNFTIGQRFGFMEDLVGMVIHKSAPSLIISGDGGLGKTHTVLKCLGNAGFEDIRKVSEIPGEVITLEDSPESVESKINSNFERKSGDYIVVKGHSSASSLYRILYENKDALVIFDDCDSVLKDATSLNLLKGALDSYDERRISWYSEKAGSDLPSSFIFTGQVIFISNIPLSKMDDAVKTRCYKVDVSMNTEEKFDWMESCLGGIYPSIDIDSKIEVLEFMKSNTDSFKDTSSINFRTLQSLIKLRTTPTVKDWKSLAKFTMNT